MSRDQFVRPLLQILTWKGGLRRGGEAGGREAGEGGRREGGDDGEC